MWAVGIIMYLLIEGKHPLYESGVDNAQTYQKKLARCNPGDWPTEKNGCKNFGHFAKDLFAKLCSKIPIERYTAEQALRHPWITRDFESPIPLTESEKMREI
jgi:serine/threonine protein kinase